MKRFIIICLVLLVIGSGFYFGYRMAMNKSFKQPLYNRGLPLPSAEFDKVYTLSPDEQMKYIGPPFIPEREQYWRNIYSSQKESITGFINKPYTMIFMMWNGKLYLKTSTRGMNMSIGEILNNITGVPAYQIEGDKELIDRTRIPGDIIFRSGLDAVKAVELLQTILQNQVHLPIKMEWRDVERTTMVVQGSYNYLPLPGITSTPGIDKIMIYGTDRNMKGVPLNLGRLDNAFKWLADRVSMTIVNEVKDIPQNKIEFELYNTFQTREQIDLMFKHLSDQTGLTFTEETRPTRILFVERTGAIKR